MCLGRDSGRAVSQRHVIVLACVAFFVRFAAVAAFSPYIFMWLEHGGHGTYSRSIIGSLYKTAGFVAPTLWGALADWSARHRLVFAIGTTLNACFVGLLTILPHNFWWQACHCCRC
jgi:predicted MFS family arabinose efflux permease